MSTLATGETTEVFPVVMLYDHLSSVGAAMDTYSQLTRELQSDYETELRVWQLDEATSPDFSAAANHDLAEAEVIILSVRGNPPWPHCLDQWTTGAATLATVEPGHAVVALIKSASEWPAAKEDWAGVLRGAATQIHPELFVYEDRVGADAWSESPAAPTVSVSTECRLVAPTH